MHRDRMRAGELEQARLAEQLEVVRGEADERRVLLDGQSVAVARFDGSHVWQLHHVVDGELEEGLHSMLSDAEWNDELDRWAVGWAAYQLAQDRLEGDER